jgi:multidrug efflux pump subunit AcrB
MLRFLLKRPIGVMVTLIAVLSVSVLSFINLPVSLLPELDVPVITVLVYYPNASTEEVEQNVIRPIRENLLTIPGLEDIESVSQSETGNISLQFHYGTQMNLAYIEANERIDRLTPILPSNLNRPIVIKSTTSDIPALRIQVIPKSNEDMVSASDLCSKVLKRRIEQIEGVGFVDINGVQKNVIRVSPDHDRLRALNLTEMDVSQAIRNSNVDFGSLSIKDGNYQYFLKLDTKLKTHLDIEAIQIPLPKSNGSVQLKQVATVTFAPNEPSGFHIFNGKVGLAIAIHKKDQARLHDLKAKLNISVKQFQKDYPNLDFHTTQDQSLLLTLSIQNLYQTIFIGGSFAFAILFIFMRGWREPIIVGFILPISLFITFSVFYLFQISLNVISLCGLSLGLGMLVDNSIVVLDNIVLKQKEGNDLFESCIQGTREVIIPLISSAMTNLAVFIPIIFLNGLTGALFYDQAVAVSVILVVSICCTFVFVPLLYALLFKDSGNTIKRESRLFLLIKRGYETSFQFVWDNKKLSALFFGLIFPMAFLLAFLLPRQGFPSMNRNELVLSVDWNESIDAKVCLKRVVSILEDNATHIMSSEADVGIQQFILNNQKTSLQQAHIYLTFDSQEKKVIAETRIRRQIVARFPNATFKFDEAPNAFEQIFSFSNKEIYEARFRNSDSNNPLQISVCDSLKLRIRTYPHATQLGKGFETESFISLKFDFDLLKRYGIPLDAIFEPLEIAFGDYLITDFRNFGETVSVVFSRSPKDFNDVLREIEVKSIDGESYFLREFVHVDLKESLEKITSDESGSYHSVSIQNTKAKNDIESDFMDLAKSQSLTVDFDGEVFDNQNLFNQLLLLLAASLILVYIILCAEFESLAKPFIILFTIPIGFAGSLALLWFFGGSINIMSGIGLMIVAGIIDNDAILKIDRIDRLGKQMPIEDAIKQAGRDRLKPIVMNTFTNVLAISPVIFSSGLGADLQRPIAITSIGGLIVGTLTALYVVPLLYWFIYKARAKSMNAV